MTFTLAHGPMRVFFADAPLGRLEAAIAQRRELRSQMAGPMRVFFADARLYPMILDDEIEELQDMVAERQAQTRREGP